MSDAHMTSIAQGLLQVEDETPSKYWTFFNTFKSLWTHCIDKYDKSQYYR